MLKSILFTCTAVLCTATAFTQDIPMLTQVALGGNGQEFFNRIEASPTDDGYYLLASSGTQPSGDKTCPGYGSSDYWLVKLNHNFSVEWDKCLGGSSIDTPVDMVISGDKIYVAGSSVSIVSGIKTVAGYGDQDVWILCLDLDGNVLWQNVYGGTGTDTPSLLMDISTSSLLIGAQSNSGITGNKTEHVVGGYDAWLLEIDKTDGSIIRQKTIGSANAESFMDICKSAANTYYMAVTTYGTGISGDKTENGYGDYDIWMMELDEDFHIVQSKIFGGTGTDELPQLTCDANNIYLACSSSSPVSGNKSAANYQGNYPSTNGWLLKLELNFNIVWDKCYGGHNQEIPLNIEKMSGGQLLMSMQSYSEQNSGNKSTEVYGDSDVWNIIADPADGSISMELNYGGSGRDFGIVTRVGNEYIFGGSSESMISGNKVCNNHSVLYDIWIGKVALDPSLGIPSQAPDPSVSVYPNPFSKEATLDLTSIHEPLVLHVYTMDGRIVLTEKIASDADTYILHLPEGNIYTYCLTGAKVNITGKLVVK